MAAIEQRGAFTDPWGREFLSDGTLIKGKEGEEDEVGVLLNAIYLLY